MDLAVCAHARVIGSDAEVSVDANNSVPLGSVFKLFVLVALASRVADRTVDLSERIRVDDANRTPGPTGLSLLRDPIELSLHDLAVLMMSVSDNTATDAILQRIGLEQVNIVLRQLGLVRSRVAANCQGLLQALARDLGTELDGLNQTLANIDHAALAHKLAVGQSLDVGRTTSSTPRELTSTLDAIWRETVVPSEQAAWCRRLLGTQIFRTYLATAFAGEAVVAGKSGLLPTLIGEAGVIEFPDGFRVALAVFVSGDARGARAVDAHRMLERIARDAVFQLRMAAAC